MKRTKTQKRARRLLMRAADPARYWRDRARKGRQFPTRATIEMAYHRQSIEGGMRWRIAKRWWVDLPTFSKSAMAGCGDTLVSLHAGATR